MTRKELIRMVLFVLGLFVFVTIWGLYERQLPPEERSKLECMC